MFLWPQEESAEAIVHSVTAIEEKSSDNNATVSLRNLRSKLFDTCQQIFDLVECIIFTGACKYVLLGKIFNANKEF